jgi:uncharacterized membrane protein
MGPGNQRRVSRLLLRALAGIETGVLGGFAMLAWLAASSALEGQPIWMIPNLLGSVFHNHDILRRGFSWVTVNGLALHFFVAGLIGLVFGVLTGSSRTRLRVALLAIMTGLLWYYFSETLFWRKLGLLARIYGPPRSLLLAHLIFGFVLATYPRSLASLERHFFGEPARSPRLPASAPDPMEP